MQFLRKFLLVLLVPLFTLLLYTTAVDVGFVRVGTHPATVKHILVTSGIYNSVVPGLLDQGKQISGSGGDVSLTNPVVKAAALKTFNPQFVQKNSETVIDGVYDWLNGTTPLPDFQIDLTSTKIAFAANVAAAVEKQAQSLPPCTTPAQVSSFDALNATCLPPGVTPASAAATVQSNILTGKGFLDNPVITANSIKNGDNNQSVFAGKNIKNLPSDYQKAKKSPLALAALLLLIGLAIFFLSLSHAAGLKKVGVPLLIVGIILLVFAWSINKTTAKVVVPKIKLNNSVLQSSIRVLIVDVEQAVDKSYWYFGAGYALLGAAALTGSMYLNRGAKPKAEPAAAPTAAASDKPTPPEPPKTPPAPKPKKQIKVQ